MEKNRLYRFFVPELNKHKQRILKEKRDDFINVIERESCQQNGGFTAYEGRGGYLNDKGELMNEDITIIETYGKNPLPPDRMKHCQMYLAQESLVVVESVGYEFVDYKEGKPDLSIYKLPEKEDKAA